MSQTPPPGPRLPAASRDPVVWLGVAVWLLALLPSYIAVGTPEAAYSWADQYADGAIYVVALLVALHRARVSPGARQRDTFLLLGMVSAAVLGVRVLYATIPEEAWGWGADLSSDLFYLLGYLALALALERRADRIPAPGHRANLQHLEIAGAMVFALGLLAYLVLVPGIFHPDLYASWVPSLLLYGVLDLFLLSRVWHVYHSGRAPQWRRCYFLLGVTVLAWFVTDVAEGLMYLGTLPWVDAGTPLDTVWHVPGLLFFLALRSHDWPVPERWENRDPDQRESQFRRLLPQGSSLLTLALSLPVLHLVLSLSGFITDASRAMAEALLLATLAALTLLLLRHRAIRARMAHELEGDRRLVEDQLQAAQRLEAVGRLAAGVSHDFSNVLSVIRGRAEMLLMLPLDAQGRTDADEIVQAAQRGESLVNHLLTLSRRRPGEPEVLDVAETLRDLRPLLKRVLPESITFTVREEAPAVTVVLDRAQMEQVLLNLVVNARDAMPDGGRLSVSTHVVELDDTFLAVHGGGEAGEYVLLCVEDEGSGIPPEIRRLVFEPFFTTRERDGGSGLGLSIVYGIARAAGGLVRIADGVAGGARVEVYLPKSGRAAEGQAPARRQPHHRSGRGTVLVVEDYEALRRTTVRVLTEAGYRVLDAANGVDALGVLDRRNEPVDLLLADLVLPDISGYALAERARESRPDLIALFMSGYASVITPIRPGEGPPVLEKPFSPQELVAAVNAALLSGRPPPSFVRAQP